MEAVGQLAGGIAHDFNNLLTAILGYSELVLEQVGERISTWRPICRKFGKAGERARGLTSQLLAFSRKQVLQPQILDLNAIISEVERMLRRVIAEDIRFEIVVDPNAEPRQGGSRPDSSGPHEPGHQRARRDAARRDAPDHHGECHRLGRRTPRWASRHARSRVSRSRSRTPDVACRPR